MLRLGFDGCKSFPLLIPREAPSRAVYNLVAREAGVYHTSIARPVWFSLGYTPHSQMADTREKTGA